MSEAQTAEKKVPFCRKSIDGSVVVFAFGNGTTLSLDLNDLSEETQDDLRGHGALQKIGDSYSSAGGDYAYAIAAAEKTIENLRNGLWGAPRTGSSEGKKSVGELATAIAALKGQEVGAVAAALEAATEEQRKALRANVAVKAKIAELRAAKAAAAAAKAGDVALDF